MELKKWLDENKFGLLAGFIAGIIIGKIGWIILLLSVIAYYIYKKKIKNEK